MLQISDADIAWAEGILLPGGCTFNEERRNFIRCMESRDVVACPGSGKTTALLAKLLILARHMPFPDSRGICVLTHTNVAIDKIKELAGHAADALLRYPNFFSTIQEFAHRFLAIPAYVARFGQRDIRIDEDLYSWRARKSYFDADLQKDAAIFCQLSKKDKSLPWREQLPKKVEFFRNLGFKFDGELVHYTRGDTGSTFLSANGTSPSYPIIHEAKYSLLKEGYLRYQDAFPLALWYLSSHPSLASVLRRRFAFVFVDEAQDTNVQQLDMFKAAFPPHTDIILQCLGDPNQAIYHSEVRKDMLWSPTQPALPFSDSLRYGKTIATVLNRVRIDCQLSLLPNPKQPSLPPHMLIFESGSEKAVLPTFANLIREYGLHETKKPCFKAVGWVGKDKTDENKVCLRYYHPDYQKTLKSKSRCFDSLLSYVHAMRVSQLDNPGNAGAIAGIAMEGIVRTLYIGGVKHPKTNRSFTSSTLKRHLKDDESLDSAVRLALSKWTLAFHQGLVDVEELRDGMAAFIRKHFFPVDDTNVSEFLDSKHAQIAAPKKKRANTYVSKHGDPIEIGTVHSVKGETHTATLYLETFYRALDSKRLLPFCLGDYPKKESKQSTYQQNLKIAHVAFSRPTHLLAFACCREHVAGHDDKLSNAGWVIREIVKEEANDDPF